MINWTEIFPTEMQISVNMHYNISEEEETY